MAQPEPPSEPTPTTADRPAPATASAVLGWWALALVLSWLVALPVGLVAGLLTRVAAGDGAEFADLGAVVVGILAAVAFAYLWLVVAAVLLVRRFVPAERRTPGWIAVIAVVLLVGAVVGGYGLTRFDLVVLVPAGAVVAALVPALVVPRLRPRATGRA